jgi:hypothetical protein
VSIKIQVEHKGAYVLLHCRGTFTLESALEVFERALESAEREGVGAVLVDAREVGGGPPSTTDRYELGKYIAEHGGGTRVAVVGSELLIDPARFGELVAVNRGAAGKAFTELTDAVAWLGQDRDGAEASALPDR